MKSFPLSQRDLLKCSSINSVNLALGYTLESSETLLKRNTKSLFYHNFWGQSYDFIGFKAPQVILMWDQC